MMLTPDRNPTHSERPTGLRYYHRRLFRQLPQLLGAVLAGSSGCWMTPPPDDGTPAPDFHQRIFAEVIPAGFQSPADCLICHQNFADGLAGSGHWQWQGVSSNIVGHTSETHGKRDLINAFQLGISSNEAYCSGCHFSFGWADKTFDFSLSAGVDCLICHDSTGTYVRLSTSSGTVPAIDTAGTVSAATPDEYLRLVDQTARPTRRNCGACHFYAEGGDNVLHGDMSSALLDPTMDVDVHMGSVASGGQGFLCQDCHRFSNHQFSGWTLHSHDEGGDPPTCTRCHSPTAPHEATPGLDYLLNLHVDRLACELCHLPTVARHRPTLVAQYWDTAGLDITPIPTDALGQPTYDRNRGTLVWAKDVVPVARWFDGRWRRKIMLAEDTYPNAGTVGDPVVLAEPVATKNTAGAKIYPFKVMRGRQPADTVNQRLIVPHLYGSAAGANPFWEKYDWAAALAEGAAYGGVAYSGTHGFVNTLTYLSVNHEIPPREFALLCESCHWTTWHWAELGLTDPLLP